MQEKIRMKTKQTVNFPKLELAKTNQEDEE